MQEALAPQRALSFVARRGARAVRAFVEGAGFPLFVLSLLAGSTAVTAVLLLVPRGDSALASFAEDFRVWCLGVDAGGAVPWGSLAATVAMPAVIALATVVIWLGPLRAALSAWPARSLAPVLAGLGAVALATGGLVAFAGPVEEPDLAFPARELRTSVPAPDFELVDHLGRDVTLSSFRGRVVVLTGIYARCPTACPLILAQAKSVVAGLTDEELDSLSVLAVTLDPERDAVEDLTALAEGHRLESPPFHFLTGDIREVNRLLDRLDVQRYRDDATGLIEHAPVYVVVDRSGRIAYRFSMGELQERWLAEALRLLVAEPVPTA